MLHEDGIQGNIVGELSAALAPWSGDWLASGVGYSLTYADLDNNSDPREGIYAKLSQTYYGVGGDANYLTTDGQASLYHLLNEEADLVFFARARGGHIETFGGTTMRNGFLVRTVSAPLTISRRIRNQFVDLTHSVLDHVTRPQETHLVVRPIGTLLLKYSSRCHSCHAPLDYVELLFADAGMLFNLDAQAVALATAAAGGATASALGDLNDESIRASVGGSIIWASPFGPLRVDYAIPIASESYDDLREFNFGVSSKF